MENDEEEGGKNLFEEEFLKARISNGYTKAILNTPIPRC